VCNSNVGNYTSVECADFGGIGYVVQYNYTALHAAPLYQTLADEALVRQALNSDTYTIQCTIQPLPITEVEEGIGAAEDAFTAWFLVVLSFPFIAGAFATFVVDERASKAKHLQTVAGVEPTAYWTSTFFWDVLNYQIPCWITVILMYAFSIDVLTTSERDVSSGVISLLILFGPAAAGFTYCVSFAFTSSSLCNVFVIISGFLVGMGGPLTCFILRLIGEDPGNPKPNLITAAKVVTWILRFVPSFCLGKGLFNAINIETFDYLEEGLSTAWSEPILLYEIIFLAAETVGYLALAVYLDKWSTNPRAMSILNSFVRIITCGCCCPGGSSGEDGGVITAALPADDDDVLAEEQRVLNGEANGDLIVLSQLRKVYSNGKVAVNNLSLGIKAGECFGLLGINGAGTC
jgi:ABC-type multidrug transport system fused ATPase/permease subunit